MIFNKITKKDYSNLKQEKGFTLVELLLYISGMIMILGLIIFFIIQTYNIYQDLVSEQRIDRVGSQIVDTITREIRTGESLVLGESILGVANGQLTFNAIESGSTIEKVFSIVDGRIAYRENSGELEYITPDDVTVTGLYFTMLNSSVSTAIQYSVDIEITRDDMTETKFFSSLSILRYSYE
jgi:type II secretory pathway pseudopilin PulG